MTRGRKVAFCGSSVFMAGLETCLRDTEGLDIARFDPGVTGDLGRQLNALHPDVIVLELGGAGNELAVRILREYPGIPVFGLDLASGTVMVLSSQTCATPTAADLADVLRTATAVQGNGGNQKRVELPER